MVYVDKLIYRDVTPFGCESALTCHLFADGTDELHGFAARMGLKREWFQVSRSGIPHYDISASMRAVALKLGALPVARIPRHLSALCRPPREGRSE